ncbi:hypothetical protein SAMN05880557_105305 [Pseudacidovorax sp. RU35E]|nr:hypothetical protein SAMN05880557_105305 [Pseudacidovorax sp. RU35E]
MPLRGSPLSRAFGLEGGAPSGLAKPVPRVLWHGLLRGRSSFAARAGRSQAVTASGTQIPSSTSRCTFSTVSSKKAASCSVRPAMACTCTAKSA